MKWIMVVVGSALILTVVAQPKPKNKDNMIIVSGEVSVNQLARFLVLEGYEIETKDVELGYITTAFRDVSKGNNSSYKLKAVIKENQVDFTG